MTPPYSPKSNGVAKIKNKTFKEMMNSLLVSASTPDNLWVGVKPYCLHVIYKIEFHKRKLVRHPMSYEKVMHLTLNI